MKTVLKLIIFLIISFIGTACERDYTFRGNARGVSFSTDTLMFDTIFTSIGSTTRNFRIYNTHGSDMTIDRISLAGNKDSKFRMNVNGTPGPEIEEVRLRSGDSLFVFVDLTIDPSGSEAPFVVADSILIHTRDAIQDVKLIAYGQNVHLLKGEKLKSQTFTAEKPYLIYDFIIVEEGETLTIEQGARLHFHKNASLLVYGTLQVNGSLEEPVLFTGSRLEEWYADKPGQWGCIWLMPGSKNHSINYANIRNGTMGLVVDSVGLFGEEPLYLSNTRIEHKTRQGLLAQNAAIITHNSLFADCGNASVALTVGGHYEFYHSTIANYYRWAYRSAPALLLSNFFYKDEELVINPMSKALFSNCIIYGHAETELKIDFKQVGHKSIEGESLFDHYLFDHCLIRSSSLSRITVDNYNQEPHFKDVILNSNPFFKAPTASNFLLDTLSVAIGAANMQTAQRFPVDYLGNSRKERGDLGFVNYLEEHE